MSIILRYDTLEPKTLYYPVAGHVALLDINIIFEEKQPNTRYTFSLGEGHIIVYRMTVIGTIADLNNISGINDTTYSALETLLQMILNLDHLRLDEHRLYIPLESKLYSLKISLRGCG